MKKFLMFLVLSTFAFVACETEPTNDVKPVIKVTTGPIVEFDAEGGTNTIDFMVSNGVDSKRVAITESADWVSVVTDTTSAEITVDANSGAAREAVLTLSYANADDVTVTVKQAAMEAPEGYDVEFTAQRFDGMYGGKSSKKSYNYYVILSDIGVTPKLETKANGNYYFFDIYAATEGDATNPVLPNGTYTFDSKNSYAAGTFTDEGSWYARMDGDNGYAAAWSITSATVVVTDKRFDAEITFNNGEKHHVVYEGALVARGPLSTLSADYNFTIEGASIKATNYGDSYELGNNNWYIEAVEDLQNGDMFMIELLSDSATDCYGLYTMYANSGVAADYSYKFLPGVLDANGGLACSWYAKLAGGKISSSTTAPLSGGIIKVESVEGGAATITLACTDDIGNKIEGTISGTFEVVVM